MLKKFSKELGVAEDKVKYVENDNGAIEIAIGTPKKNIAKLFGLDQMDAEDKQAQRINKFVLGQYTPIDAAIFIWEDPNTEPWCKLTACLLAVQGIDPIPFLVKKFEITSPFIASGLRKKCKVCRELTDLQCSMCKSVYYCSKACARKDREIHRKDCKSN